MAKRNEVLPDTDTASLSTDARDQNDSTVLTASSEPHNITENPAKLIRQIVSILSPILFLLVWQASTNLKLIDIRFFPAPTTIATELVNLFQSGEIWPHLGASLSRIFWGFLAGTIPGIIIGLVMGISPLFRAVLQPLIDATFPIPKVAVLPLFLIVFGLGEGSKVAVIAVSVFYLVVINTVSGVANIPQIYFDVGRSFQANRWLVFRDIALPGALPSIVTGLKTGMGVALLVIVSAEFLGAQSGLGYLIWSAWSVFDVVQMYAGLVITAMVGIVTSLGLTSFERLVVPWKQ